MQSSSETEVAAPCMSMPVETREGPASRAYVTMVTSDSYLPGAMALAKSSKRNKCGYPLHIIVGPKVSRGGKKSLERYFASVLEVPTIPSTPDLDTTSRTEEPPSSDDVSTSNKASFHWSQSEYTKLNIWNLTQFSKIVYIDCDAILTDNIDEVRI
jgi:lipopolysaccharide biosynthesis glycosyltransferase